MMPRVLVRTPARGRTCLWIALLLIAAAPTARCGPSPPGRIALHSDRPAVATLRHRPRAGFSHTSEPASRLGQRSDLHWENAPDWVNDTPEWLRGAWQYRHRGLPLVHLWESSHYLLALGINEHGVPGIYFTQSLVK